MEKFWSPTHSFTDGAARLSDLCYMMVTQDDLSEEEIPHAILVALDGPQWGQLAHVNWSSIGIVFATVPSELAISLGEDGQVLTYLAGQEGSESFRDSPRLLRNVATIKGEVYACGMDREVFRRVAPDQWNAMHADKPKSGETLGFEAIDGYSEKEIYAAGWGGEIWRFDDGRWYDCDSPVNLILTGVACSGDGYVYVCGQEGLLVRGRADSWQVISDPDMDQDLWDVIEFGDTVYVASKTDVYEVRDDGLRLITVEPDTMRTAGRFTSRDGVLWSIGEKDIFNFDGETWTRID